MSAVAGSIHEKLEVFVFTYNRAKSLEKLLLAFSESPFRGCRFTVLDNSSTDTTAEVCAGLKGNFRELRHIRHKKNIGGLANYLRAIEMAEMEYAWVLCDDDHYKFDCDDLLKGIMSSSADLFSVGLAGHSTPGAFNGRLGDLARNAPFFFEHSLVSTLIFKTNLYTPDLIRAAYDNIYTMFPHFPFLASLVERNVSIYTCKEKMITAGVNLGYSGFAYLRGWLQSVENVRNANVRSLAYRDVFRGKPFWHILLFSILIERSHRRAKYREDYKRLVKAASMIGPMTLLKVAIVAPLVFMPEFMHKALWNKYAAYRAKQGKPLPNFDEER
jgi:glycosyltransferase involved in cell wall biosynthesis